MEERHRREQQPARNGGPDARGAHRGCRATIQVTTASSTAGT
jgi:hypothetical protein